MHLTFLLSERNSLWYFFLYVSLIHLLKSSVLLLKYGVV